MAKIAKTRYPHITKENIFQMEFFIWIPRWWPAGWENWTNFYDSKNILEILTPPPSKYVHLSYKLSKKNQTLLSHENIMQLLAIVQNFRDLKWRFSKYIRIRNCSIYSFTYFRYNFNKDSTNTYNIVNHISYWISDYMFVICIDSKYY